MATETNGTPATKPAPIFDPDRLASAMASGGLNGVVITTPLNVTYLSGHFPTAPKADEPPGNAVVISRHDMQHPIMIAPDIFLSPFLEAPIWIEDLHPIKSLLLPVNTATERAEFFRFIPASQRESGWVKQAGDRFKPNAPWSQDCPDTGNESAHVPTDGSASARVGSNLLPRSGNESRGRGGVGGRRQRSKLGLKRRHGDSGPLTMSRE